MNISRLLVGLGLSLTAVLADAQGGGGFKLVANATVGVSSVTTADASQYFLKRKTTWPDGQMVTLVDMPEGSPVRKAFSKSVLHKDVSAVKKYWQTQAFSGKASPPRRKPRMPRSWPTWRATPARSATCLPKQFWARA